MELSSYFDTSDLIQSLAQMKHTSKRETKSTKHKVGQARGESKSKSRDEVDGNKLTTTKNIEDDSSPKKSGPDVGSFVQSVKPHEINGPLTEKVVQDLWARGGSDAYGIDAHSMNVHSIESLGRRQCNKVRELDVSFNHLKQLACLDQVPSLRVLKAHGNRITAVDDYDIPKGSNLEVIYLSGNALSCIPSSLGSLRKLRELRLDSNKIPASPAYDRLYSCRKLTYLNLSRNRITSVKGIESIGTLQTLILASNDIEMLHTGIRHLDNLEDLDISGNRIQSFAKLNGMKKLSILRASGNRIASWKAVPKIATLTELYLKGNRLCSAPKETSSFPLLDVLDISSNRIDEFSQLTSIIEFKGLLSLQIAGNPVCRDDPTISRTIVKEMPWLLDIDGVDSIVLGGGTDTPDSSQILSSVAEAKEQQADDNKLPPSSSSAQRPSFTLSIASVLGEGKSVDQSEIEEKSASEGEKEQSDSASLMKLNLSDLSIRKQLKSGEEFGLRRPLSSRGKTPRSPRLVRAVIRSKEADRLEISDGSSSSSSYALPVMRAASLRTGRGARLKRIEDVDQMATKFRSSVAAERDFITAASHHRITGDEPASASHGASKCEADLEIGDSTSILSQSNTAKIAEPTLTTQKMTKAKPKSRNRHRSLSEALAFSRKTNDEVSENASVSHDSAALSPNTSEDSRSTVTDASPSPSSLPKPLHREESLDDKSLNVIHARSSSSQKEPADSVEIPIESVSSWSKKHLHSTMPKSSGRKGNPLGRAHRSAMGRKRQGFGSFRVPRTAKNFVRSHLDSEEKQSTLQASQIETDQRVSRK